MKKRTVNNDPASNTNRGLVVPIRIFISCHDAPPSADGTTKTG